MSNKRISITPTSVYLTFDEPCYSVPVIELVQLDEASGEATTVTVKLPGYVAVLLAEKLGEIALKQERCAEALRKSFERGRTR